jgi:hypothetical protein
MKSFSFLSLALTGVAGVTAAFIPAKKSEAQNTKQANDGWLTGSSDEGRPDVTCEEFIAGEHPGQVANCTYTTTEATPGAGIGSGTSWTALGITTSGTTPLVGGLPNPTFTGTGTGTGDGI